MCVCVVFSSVKRLCLNEHKHNREKSVKKVEVYRMLQHHHLTLTGHQLEIRQLKLLIIVIMIHYWLELIQ